MNLLKVEQQICLNQRLKHQNCQICMGVCPKQAIHIDAVTAKVTMDDHCDQCGICLRHCPTQAIQWLDTKRYPLRSENGKVEVCCQKLKCDGYVSCLANLNEFELVYLALQANIYLCMDEELCKECTIKVQAEVQILLQKANLFLTKIAGTPIKLSLQDKSTAEQINRRELFGFFFTKMKQSFVEMLPIAAEATDYRRLLIAALATRQTGEGIDAGPLFWGLQAKNCNMCGICVKMCKNAALSIEIAEDQAVGRLKHNQSRCVGCGACQQICAQNALQLSSKCSSFVCIVNQTTVVIAEKNLASCSCCNRLFIDDGVDICVDCRRKQKKKMQAIY